VLAATSLEWAVCDFAIWAAGVVTSLMPVTSADGAIRAAASLGGPVVLKADVPGLVHRTDAGAVQLDLRTEVDQARLPPADRQVRPARQGADPADDHRRNRGLH